MQENGLKMATQEVQIPKTPKIRKRNPNDPLTREEVSRLINNTTELEDRTLFILGFNTGMRVSEIVNIPWVSVDWSEGLITIWDEKKNRYRRVMLDSYTLNSLRLWQNAEGGMQEKIFEFSAKTVQSRLQYWSQKTLGKRKSWHCVRHTYITLQVIAATPVSIVSDNTGDSPATIYKYYTQIPPQQKREFVEKGAVYSDVHKIVSGFSENKTEQLASKLYRSA